jgi:hypothetical protein
MNFLGVVTFQVYVKKAWEAVRDVVRKCYFKNEVSVCDYVNYFN